MATKVDYDELKKLYVTEHKSYRELSRMFPIVSFSTIAERGRKEDWDGSRRIFEASIARRSYEGIADAVAHEQSQIRSESVLVARAYVRKFAVALAEDKVQMNSKDAIEFIRLLADVLAPAKISETKDGPTILEGKAVRDDGFLRRVVELARGGIAPAGGAGPGLLVSPPGTRSN
jgi:hypothetical protein